MFCRIATICDVYDAATTARCYSAAKLPVQALYEMKTCCADFFDSIVTEAFYQLIPAFPLGQVVVLSTGEEAVVVGFNPNVPNRPKVQFIKDRCGRQVSDPSLQEFALAIYRNLDVVEVDGCDVRQFVVEDELSFAEPVLA